MIQKLVGQSVMKASTRPSQASLSASATDSTMPRQNRVVNALRRGRRSDHQGEDQQHADDLHALRHRERDDRQEQRPDSRRSDTPFASASSGCRLANSSGRAMAASAATATMPSTSSVQTVAASIAEDVAEQ